MPPSLEDARAKLRRSHEHLSAVAAEYFDVYGYDLSTFKPPNLDVKVGYEFDGGVKWMVFMTEIPEAPSHWGLVVGDGIHNARSALDVLVYQLVLLNNKQPTKRTQFPIYDKPPTQRQRQTIEQNLKGLHPDHAKRIRQLQPFRRSKAPESVKLARLGLLDNIDKHRLVHPVLHREDRDALKGRQQHVHFRPKPPPGHRVTIFIPGALDEINPPRLEIVRVSGVPDETEVVIDFWASLCVGFGFPEVTLADLFEIRSYAVEIVEGFAPDFS